MDPWIWALVLLILGLGLAVLEIFFPSAGILGFLSFCSILAAIVMGFQDAQRPWIGFAVTLVAVVGVPVVLIAALRVWPKTAIGRRVLLISPTPEEVLPDDQYTDYLRSLLGEVGQTKCKMLPAGAIIIDGRTIDAITQGMPVEAGEAVRVIEVKSNRVVVRPLADEETLPESEDPLRRPIDIVGDDPFHETTRPDRPS